MNIYELHDVLKEHAKFKLENNIYSAIWKTGDFDGCYDYLAGILEIRIFSANAVYMNNYGALTISTVDDGGWSASSKHPITLEVAERLAKDLTDTFHGKLPSAATLNDFLIKYQMYGLPD